MLIDLDQTLVETSALAELRRQRKWAQVYQLFHVTTLFPDTRQFLQAMRDHPLLSPGIVTTSPRPYAERLVAYHRCRIPVVVAYHDSPGQKPFPDPLLQAAERLRVPVARCFHIGDAPDDIVAALRASAFPIGLCRDDSLRKQAAALPTYPLCRTWGEVLRVIITTMEAQEHAVEIR